MSYNQVIDEIFELYEHFGQADYIGEPVSQIEHMSQSAQLAIDAGCDDEVVLAAFFHDIGHICAQANSSENMGGYGVKSHEKIGADYLRSKGFSERMAMLVENHVRAKRYLTYVIPSYYKNLSEASKETLLFQGGIMRKEEADAFEKDDLFELSILLRKWDEEAKTLNVPLLSMDMLKLKCLGLLQRSN